MRWDEQRIHCWLFDSLLDDYEDEYDYFDGLEIAPHLLRAFIRFAHNEVGIRGELTDEVLAALDSWELGYQAMVRRKLTEDDDEWFEIRRSGGV
jgi:hypothetical protein